MSVSPFFESVSSQTVSEISAHAAFCGLGKNSVAQSQSLVAHRRNEMIQLKHTAEQAGIPYGQTAQAHSGSFPVCLRQAEMTMLEG